MELTQNLIVGADESFSITAAMTEKARDEATRVTQVSA